MAFSEPSERKNLEGIICLHIDCYLNSCIMKKVIRDAGAGKRIGNYVVAKFQESIKDKYILHSSSTKMMTSRQYKDAKSGI